MKNYNTLKYEPIFQGKYYKDDTMLFNLEYMIGSPVTEIDETEHIVFEWNK